MNINFIYDKFYPNQKDFKYDFYLVEYNVYIEYFGMLKVKVNGKNDNIIRNYKTKCKGKLDLCVRNNYKFIFSMNVDDIINRVKRIVNGE